MKDFICKKCGNTTYIMREKLNGTGKAIGLYCAKCGTWHKWSNEQEKVLYSTHSAEIDYVADSKAVQTITDLLIEFDEMGFAPTTVCENPEQYAIDWRERVRQEFARLTVKNAELRETFSKMETVEKELRKRLENAVELPCVKMVNPKVRINRIGIVDVIRDWAVVYIDRQGVFVVEHCKSKTAAEARLEELKGEQK